MVGLHVDNLGCGKDGHPEYEHLKLQLKDAFNFKRWTEENEDKPLEFCGCHLSRTPTESKLRQAEYLKGVKPMTCINYDSSRDLTFFFLGTPAPTACHMWPRPRKVLQRLSLI